MAHLYKSIQIFPTLRLRAHVKVEGSIDPTIESASCSKVQIHFLSPNGPFDTVVLLRLWVDEILIEGHTVSMATQMESPGF